jgi:hypothetical protein
MVSLGKPQFHATSCGAVNIGSISGSPLLKEDFLLCRLMFLVCVCVETCPTKEYLEAAAAAARLDAVVAAAAADCNIRRVTGAIN